MKSLTHRLIALLFAIAGVLPAVGQTDGDTSASADNVITLPSARHTGPRGYYMTEIDGEEVKMIVLHDVYVFPPMKFKNKKEEDFYWKTVRDVKKTLPYAKLICATLIETYEYIETFPTQKEREEHLKQMEKEVFKQYKPILRRLTKSQAQLLVKLIRRETNQSSYNIIKAFLGSFRAGFWQTFGRLFGVNLKGEYNPEKDRHDAIIERVVAGVEAGAL